MPNGERIQFANNINFIFECHSLAFASPATVSRCGMIFLSDEAVDVDRMLKKWLQTHTASDQSETGKGGQESVGLEKGDRNVWGWERGDRKVWDWEERVGQGRAVDFQQMDAKSPCCIQIFP
jgi:hypothetical protein